MELDKHLLIDSADEVKKDFIQILAGSLPSRIQKEKRYSDKNFYDLVLESQIAVTEAVRYHLGLTGIAVILSLVVDVINVYYQLPSTILGLSVLVKVIYVLEAFLREHVTKRFSIRRDEIKKSKKAAIIALRWNERLKNVVSLSCIFILCILYRINKVWSTQCMGIIEVWAKERYGQK